MAKATLEERFWAKVNRHGPIPPGRPDLGPCWLWTGEQNGRGYGRFTVIQARKRTRHGAHRFAFTLLVGPIPEGLEPDHRCGVKHCVKATADEHGPAHLELVTHAENLRRGVKVAVAARTHCSKGHPLTADNIYQRPNGGRNCRACAINRSKARWQRLASEARGNDARSRLRRG